MTGLTHVRKVFIESYVATTSHACKSLVESYVDDETTHAHGSHKAQGHEALLPEGLSAHAWP